jgi:uncharacterized protein (DUF697 family)
MGHGTKTSFLAALTAERAEQLAHASSEVKTAAVRDLIRKTSATAAATALQPVPALDVAILTPLQHRMVHSIGLIRGWQLEDEQVKRMFRAVRQPIVVSQTTLVAVKLVQWIPGVPEVFAASLAYALTFAIGEVSDQYLSRPFPVGELKSRMEEVSRERFAVALQVKRDELRSLFRDPETRGQVKELTRSRREGKIDDDEVVRRMDAILGTGARHHGKPLSRAVGGTSPPPRA